MLICWGNNDYGQTPNISLSPSSLPAGNESYAYSQAINPAGGTPPYNVILAQGSLPAGLTLSSGGLLSGTPTEVGTFNFTLQADDSNLMSGSQAYSLRIYSAPVANNQSVNTPEGTPLGITLTVVNTDLDPLTWTVGDPGNGILAGTPPNLTYTPAANWYGTDTFTFYINNGRVDSNTATVTIQVSHIYSAPVANNQSVNTPEGTPLGITLTVVNTDLDPLTWTVSDPGNGILAGTPPNLTYTPAANWYGTDTFTFYINNGRVDSNTATVTIQVSHVNHRPEAPVIPDVAWIAQTPGSSGDSGFHGYRWRHAHVYG